MRILIFSSYNQVYQSAAALATACHAARRGKRVLLASSGPSHLIGTMLGQSLGPRPLELEPNLAAIEIGPVDELGAQWDQIRPTFRSGLAARLRDIGSDELPAFPGMDAVGALLVAERARKTGRFDLLILDGPAVTALISALTLPDALRWLTRLVFGLDRGPGRSRSSQEQSIVPAALIAPTATAPLQDLRVVLEEQRATLEAGTGTRVRFVATADELHYPHLRTALTALGVYGLAADEIIVPAEPTQVDLAIRHEFSAEASPIRPHLRIGALPHSPGIADEWALRGAALYRDGDVATELPKAPHHDPREIRLAIPFLEPKELDVAVASEEVVLRLGQIRRHMLLPGLLEGGRLRARVEGETLRLWIE
jgi:arsenite/tail-anchored protein-transporting ATPase